MVYLPYGAVERPSIALGLLKQIIRDAGFSCQIHYANMEFAERIGLFHYDAIGRVSRELMGEWTFAGAAFPDAPADHRAYAQTLGRIFKPEAAEAAGAEIAAQLGAVRAQAEAFIEDTADRLVARRPRIVGVSSMFQQHCAALALLRRIKAVAPETVTLLGGANCEGKMGEATWRNFDFVDYVVSGEADGFAAELIGGILARGLDIPAGELPAGVLGPRSPRAGASALGRARVERLDESPVPDYDDYFASLARASYREHVVPGLPIETSRGCWWGAVKHCTFCGLNGGSMAFRSKSPGRAVAEFTELSARYDNPRFMVVDNIIDLDYFKSVLPHMAAAGLGRHSIFYETKANLKRDQLAAFRAAGVTWIQPGIESLSDNQLKQLEKGTTGLINVRLLKWAREIGLYVSWNILYDMPFAADADYAEVAELIPAICHLQPPQAMIRIRVERFSPYQQTPDRFGLQLEPAWAYRHVYPLAESELRDLCYMFDVVGEPGLQTTADSIPDAAPDLPAGSGLAACHRAVARWRAAFAAPAKPVLCMEDQGDERVVLDTRPCAAERVARLPAAHGSVLDACDAGATRRAIAERCAGGRVAGIVDELVERRLLLPISNKYLSLPVPGDLPTLPPGGQFPGGYIEAAPAPSDFSLA